MADHSAIEWTDATWNPIVGCSVLSPGCTNCYAMKLAGTRMKHHHSRADLTVDSKAGPVWNGDVRFMAAWLDQPLRWKRPRKIFVCAHGDLFHHSVPDEWIDQVFAVMALAPQHTFQVLTKRAERMRNYAADLATSRLVYEIVLDMALASDLGAVLIAPGSDERSAPPGKRIFLDAWPLQNCWLGVSVEDQPRADERIPHLLATPAAKRFISAEPLLGPVDLMNLDINGDSTMDALNPPSPAEQWRADWDPAVTGTTLDEAIEGFEDWGFTYPPSEERLRGLDWVIVGGESGKGARPMHPDWARSLRDQCQAADVPFFFKQWGEWAPHHVVPGGDLGGDVRAGRVTIVHPSGRSDVEVYEATGGLSTERGSRYMARIGKKAAGALLDGREHREFPA